MIIYIYALLDPRDSQIRYIGRTRNSLKLRLTQHLSDKKKNTYKLNWIKSLKKIGVKPDILLIRELNCSWEESHVIEKAIISEYFTKGHKLVNLTDKGNCSIGLSSYAGKNDRPIIQYDLEGNFIKEWPSLVFAARGLNIKVKGIHKGLNGNKSAFGYQWKYKTKDYLTKIDKYQRKNKWIKTLQYSLTGEFIKEWQSATEAAKFYNVHQAEISGAVRSLGKCVNFQWRYATDTFFPYIEPYKSNEKEIKATSTSGELIIFDSLAEAGKFVDVSYVSIRNWCKSNTFKKGYYWEFNNT